MVKGWCLPGKVFSCSFCPILGSNYEYSFETELGPIFVVSPDLDNVLRVGADVGLRLADHGVSVVQLA